MIFGEEVCSHSYSACSWMRHVVFFFLLTLFFLRYRLQVGPVHGGYYNPDIYILVFIISTGYCCAWKGALVIMFMIIIMMAFMESCMHDNQNHDNLRVVWDNSQDDSISFIAFREKNSP